MGDHQSPQWIDDDGAWLKLRNPAGLIVLFGPFVPDSDGSKEAKSDLEAAGWTEAVREGDRG